MNDEPIKTPIPLPYTEDDNYVDSLVDRCTERAITQAAMHRTNGKRRTIAVVSTAAAIALVATVAVRMLHKPSLPSLHKTLRRTAQSAPWTNCSTR